MGDSDRIMRNQRGQGNIELILLIAAVVGILLLLFRVHFN